MSGARAALIAVTVAAGCSGEVHRLATRGMLGAPDPASFLDNGLYATVAVDGVAGHLLVDTGAPVTVLSPSRFPGAAIPTGAGAVDLTVGGLTVLRAPELAVELFPARPGFAPGGLLGGSLLCQFAVVLDYRGGEVRLSAAPPTDLGDVQVPGVTVPFRLEGGGRGVLGGTTFAYPATRVSVAALVDGKPRTLILDSGASWMVVRHALWGELAADGRPTLTGVPILSAEGVVAGQLTRARTVSVAGETVADPPVLDVGDELLDAFAAEVGHPVDGLLGGAWLRQFAVTIDYPSGALWLARYRTTPHIDPDELHQLGFVLEAAAPDAGQRWVIRHVYPGTSAAQAGLVDGDPLVSVGGVALDALAYEDAEKLLHGAVGEAREVVTSKGSVMVKIDDLLPPP